jgi:hypothetical protein
MLRAVERRSAAVSGSVLRRLPGTSAAFGPPRQVGRHLQDHSDYREIYPAFTLVRRPPLSLEEELHPSFQIELTRRMDPAGIGVIANGRVYTAMAAVMAPPDTLVFDVSHTAGSEFPEEHPIFTRLRLPPITRIDAAVAVLRTYPCCIGGHYYYGHWMLDTLPRLHLLRESGVGWDKIVAPQATGYHRDTLRHLDVPAASIISAHDLHIEAARLVVPTLPGIIGNPPSWVVDFLRRSFLGLAGRSPYGDRLYISRSLAGSRHVENEEALIASLRPRGFRPILLETLSFAEQVTALAGAKIVVAPHTTGLTNTVFCQPGTAMVEIFSPRYVTCCWYALADAAGLRYGYIIGEGERRGPMRVHENIRVNVASVHAMLDLLE